jgi:hypothetical protein
VISATIGMSLYATIQSALNAQFINNNFSTHNGDITAIYLSNGAKIIEIGNGIAIVPEFNSGDQLSIKALANGISIVSNTEETLRRNLQDSEIETITKAITLQAKVVFNGQVKFNNIIGSETGGIAINSTLLFAKNNDIILQENGTFTGNRILLGNIEKNPGLLTVNGQSDFIGPAGFWDKIVSNVGPNEVILQATNGIVDLTSPNPFYTGNLTGPLTITNGRLSSTN